MSLPSLLFFFHSIPLYSTPFHSVPYYPTPPHSILLSTPLYYTLLHSTPLHSTPCFVPFHSTTPHHTTPHHSIPFQSTPLHSTPLRHSSLLSFHPSPSDATTESKPHSLLRLFLLCFAISLFYFYFSPFFVLLYPIRLSFPLILPLARTFFFFFFVNFYLLSFTFLLSFCPFASAFVYFLIAQLAFISVYTSSLSSLDSNFYRAKKKKENSVYFIIPEIASKNF